MRMSVPAALAALVLGLPILFSQSQAAHAGVAATVFVETNPSTVPAGDEVGLRASCDDNLKSATVSTTVFGPVAVAPRFGLLTATALVPAGTKAGDYRIDLRCPDGGTASSTLHVVAKVAPARGPATGGGGTAPGRQAPELIGAGAAVVVAAGALGALALRRRRLGVGPR